MPTPKEDLRHRLMARFEGPQRPRVIEDEFRRIYGLDARQAPQLWDAFVFAAFLNADPAELARAIGETFNLRPMPGIH